MNQSGRSKARSKRQKARRMQAYAARTLFVAILAMIAWLMFISGRRVVRFVTSITQDKTAISGNYIKISKDGKIEETSVEDFDSSVYDENGLKELVDSEIASYNGQASDSEAVKLSKLTFKNNSAKLIIDYASAEDYASFNSTDIRLADASEVTFPSSVTSVDDGKIIDASAARDEVKGTAVLTKASVTIITPKKIRYYGDNIVLIDSKTAKVTAGETDAIIVY